MSTREEIRKEDTWDLSAIFLDFPTWKKHIETFFSVEKSKRFFLCTEHRGNFSSSSLSLKNCLSSYFLYSQQIDKISTYAHLFFDQDMSCADAKAAFDRAQNLNLDFHEQTSFIEPELLSMSQEKWDLYLADPLLKEYSFYLQKIVRKKEHVLSQEGEALLALAQKPLQLASKTFSMLNNVDFDFGFVRNEKKEKMPLTHGLYLSYLRSPDRKLRKNAFTHLHGKFKEYENTFCELLSGQVEKHIFFAKAKKYEGSLESALFPNKLPVKIYTNLIEAAKSNAGALHAYVHRKKERLKLKTFHAYDMYAPVLDCNPFSMTLEEAKHAVVASVALLGKEYQQALSDGLFHQRWLDPIETKGKRSGAYSSGCFGTYPYMLMNYHNSLNDVLILAHEAGHSMHSYLSWKNQSYPYADYPVFLAEIASIFSEQLMLDYLTEKFPSHRRLFLSHRIESFQATFFRQTLFAAFEKEIHKTLEEGGTLSSAKVNEMYLSLYRQFYGKDFFVDDLLGVEWSRIPHFYYNFYVYQYATGIAGAIYLYKKVKKEGPTSYLNFLRSGGKDYPLSLIKVAGLDMLDPAFIEESIDYFDQLVQSFSLT